MTYDVVIVGGGPNGLMLACELSLAGVRPVVLERLAEPDGQPKANGLLGRVVRVLDRRGLHERLSGSPEPPRPNTAYFMFGGLSLDLGLLEESPVHALPVPQRRVVEVLEERAIELGAEIRRGHEVVGLSQDGEAVTAEVAGPDGVYGLRARYLVGADGAHSAVRKLSGIAFPGVTYDRMTVRSAHVTVPPDLIDPASGALIVPGHGAVPPFLPRRTEHGGFSYAPMPGHPPLVSTTEWDQPATETPMSLAELRASVRRVLGADLPLGPPEGEGPHALRRLTGGNTRLAERFRDGRVFLIGDAAHVYAATGGGPGLNLGLQDAVNLGWKLAAAIRGSAPPGLLDTYETERRLAADRMVLNARAQAALIAPGSDVTGLREVFAELLRDPATVRRLAELTTGADLRYDMGTPAAHPLTGAFAPDLDLRTSAGQTTRLADLARTARPLLLDLTEDSSPAKTLAPWAGRIDIITARPLTPGAPAALLLRPDGHVAWATGSSHPAPADLQALHTAAHHWFPPAHDHP
ncbi:FAD-dependent oxidoreductase [Bailinhaonella thermotolerans]|uniref:FAD-dependent oxidoreductase n=1 Tax=Bailinhaonella thermotolerans TaxID=1070861 RepID=A0A3A4AXZ2_9ACTN|nr:FAD-dependent oxidoreductase [Bailinhaonella thermotolerans]RJL35532.1 FAD-dependent oxidoreductase [Bailinhaonella thermotolerans]